MTTFNLDDLPLVLERLDDLVQLNAPQSGSAAAQWHRSLSEKQAFLSDCLHPVVFIGKPGVGKSSVINVVANLLLGEIAPTDKASLKNLSVLATGAGRTSICEVQVQSSSQDEYRLDLEPFDATQMVQEIDLYARAEWQRFHGNKTRRSMDDDTDPTAQEWQRAIRHMTNTAEYYETYTAEDGARKKRVIKPLDARLAAFDSEAAFSAHMVESANLPARACTSWVWPAERANLRHLKQQFEAINQGSDATAMLPHRIKISIAPPFLPNQSSLVWQLIDTRGLDGPMAARADLYEWLCNPRAVVILCSSFKDAPDLLCRTLLRDMAENALLQEALSRSILLLLDQGDASLVNGADDDREIGQSLKVDECLNVLQANQLTLPKASILPLDVLQDNCQALMAMVEQNVVQQRDAMTKELQTQLMDAKAFIRDVGDAQLTQLRQQLDDELKAVMAAHLPIGAPLSDPLTGMYGAIRPTHPASIVYASCRRNGGYRNLNLYAAVKVEAERACTQWLNGLQMALHEKLAQQTLDQRFTAVRNHISLRRLQIHLGQIRSISHYAQAVSDEVKGYLQHDEVWQRCKNEWGQGGGFKDAVLTHLKSWSAKQVRLEQHLQTNIIRSIPLLNEVTRPAQAPRFVLVVRNLRTLREVNWAPEPLSILIGANAAGKTTLLLVLKLLQVAYERDLPEAVNQVLGGIHNLRAWGINEAEAVEVGLDIDQASWRLTLTASGAQANYLTSETLHVAGQEIFMRDTLGNFRYNGQLAEPSHLLGLRALMDRGAYEPAIRSMATFMQRIAIYYDPDLRGLRTKGSETTDDRVLHPRGGNTLAVLRRWNQNLQEQHRYKFVLDGLKAAFPNAVAAMDFDEAGNTVAARIYKPGSEIPGPLRTEANGVIQLMLLFCAIASAEDESIVAIDEPENCLHPYAIAVFLRRTRRWALEHKLTILLTTHSTVLLDELSAEPESVFVMKSAEGSHALPTQLSLLRDKNWLAGFKLGDLYEQGEIGSNEDDD